MAGSKLFDSLVPYLEILAVVSLITFLLSIILIPWYIGRLPSNFFCNLQSQHSGHRSRSTSIAILLLRNCVGVVLICAGIMMLFMPGQGLLTILIGILCMSFPGKLHFVLYLVNKPTIQNSLNWTRKKMRQKPFIWSE
jgi:hypothetical protein